MKTAIICDIDGTLAILNGRDPYDFNKCSADYLNMSIACILNGLSLSHSIILLTGRPERFREITEKWLRNYKVHYSSLLMRSAEDKRPDVVIKREIYDTNIEGKFEIMFVMEDRDRCVKMWRKDLGLSCLQVNYGDF